MTSDLIITPRTLLPWLLARFQCVNTGGTKSQIQPFFLLFGRVWEQDDKQWKTGNEVTRPVGPTYSHCLLPVFLQLQCHVMSCDIMWYHCDVMRYHWGHVMSCDDVISLWCHVISLRSCDDMWCHVITMWCRDDNVRSLQRVCGLSPQVLSVCLLEKFLCSLGPETQEEKKHEHQKQITGTIDTTSSSTPPSLSPLPQIIPVWFEEFRVCKLTPNTWWNSQNLTSREQGKQLTVLDNKARQQG